VRPIPGDPLTGSLPATQVLVPLERTHGAKPRRRVERAAWPLVPDPDGLSKVEAGHIIKVRGRFGVRELKVRVVNRAITGRRYLIGQSRKGWLHHAWLSDVISIRPPRESTVVNAVAR